MTAIGTWIYVDDPDSYGRWRPCMVIRRDKRAAGAKPCVVLMDNAWWWSDRIGDPRRVAHVVTAFLIELGLDVYDADDHARIIDIVLQNLERLVAMPPAPAELVQSREKIAEIRIRDSLTGHTTEAEI